MSDYLWVPRRERAPAPDAVAAYLLQRGWIHRQSNAQWAIYEFEARGDSFFIEVPQQAAAQDYPRAFSLLLDDLARLESRTRSVVLWDLKASAVDTVRLTLESAVTKDGRIPVEAGRRVYAAAREILLSAACAVIDPRPVYAKRKPDEAMRLLDRARFGQTEVGSFVLTIECSVAPRLQQSLHLDAGDPDDPFERLACVKLAHALREAEAATRESAASGSIEPFRSRIQAGVSANLCDGVAELMEATSAESFVSSFSFALRRPLLAPVPEVVTYSADTPPILREASSRLREEAVYPETDIIGPVVKLESDDPTKGGYVVLKADFEGRFRSVRVRLEPEVYEHAAYAHLERLLVKCVCELAREGRSLLLRNPRGFTVMAAEDE
jgi:hypothetical protein